MKQGLRGGVRSPLGVEAVWLLLTVASVLPFCSAGLLALTDWAHHLASAAVVLDYEDSARGLAQHYRLALSPRPYMGLTYLLVGLGQVMPLEWAGKLVLVGYGVSWSVAIRALVRSAPSRDPRLAWFGPLFVHGWSLAYGFVPFVCALPPAVFAVALLRRLMDRSTFGRWLALGLSYGLSALMHPLGVAIAVVASVGLLSAPQARWRLRGRWAVIVGVTGLLGLFATRLVPLDGARFMDAGISTAWRWTIKHRLVDFALAYLPGNLDYLVGLVGIGALVAAIGWGRRQRPATPDPLERAAWALALVYLLAPVNLAVFSLRMSLLAPRLIVPLWVFCIPLVRGRRPRLCALGATAALAHAGLLAWTHHSFDAQWGPRVAQAQAALPVGAKVRAEVAPVQTSVLNARTVRPPEAALHVYALLGQAGFDPQIFSTPQSPIQVRSEAPAHRDRQAFDYRWVQTSTTIVIKAE